MADGKRIGGHVLSEAVLPLVVHALREYAVVTLDRSGVVASWNAGAEDLLGWPSEQAIGAHVSSLLGSGGARSGITAADLEQAAHQGVLTTTRRLNRQRGDTVEAKTTVVAVRSERELLGYGVVAHVPEGAPAGAAAGEDRGISDGTMSPAEARRQLSESRILLAAETADRAQAETSRGRLLRRLVVAQEDERRRLAQDLHDGLGQRLSALRLMLEVIERSDGGPRDVIADALEMLARIDQDVDFIAWELRPAALEDLGLSRVLAAYVTEWSRYSGVPAQFHTQPEDLHRMAAEVEASIYRIAQEALNNVSKHAQARSVNVLLELRGDDVALTVEDDGVGVRTDALGRTMLGLAGMRERALAVGGTVEIEPTPGGGTTVLARIPSSGVVRERPPAAGEVGEAEDDPPVPDQGGRVAGGAAASAIRLRLRELQRAVGARDEFIATVAHELRNPIAPLTFQVRLALTRAEKLAAAGTPVSIEWVQSQLRGVEQRLHRLLETLDRLLDVSRLSTGRIDLQLEPMHLTEVVHEVLDTYEAELAVARCKVTLSASGEPTGSWDRLRVEQVVRNLLSNAIRFGAGRPIDVMVDADDDFARLVVCDHGIGIAPDQQARIFERFERGPGQRSGGFGIGLWIVRNICAAMGGAVSVESTLGEGACFTVMLPRRPRRLAIAASE